MTDPLIAVGGGYRARELLHRRGGLVVVRGVLVDGERPAIIKRVTEVDRHGVAAAQLRFEHAMLRQVAPRPVPELATPLGWVETEQDLALILEDVGGSCLDSLTANAALSVDCILTVALGVARALHHVHEAAVVHGRVAPRNIVYNPSTGRVQLIDLGGAVPLPRERPHVENVHALAACLPFIAPEQTGLGPRCVDARSDLHALGTTLYKLLTGLFPYPQQDIGSWIAALLTQDPLNPCVHVPEVPPCLAAVVCKLLSRAPEQRYQSAQALEADLQRCVRAVAQADEAEFPLGADDVGPRLAVPPALVGREVPQAQLRAAAARARAGAAAPVLVLGARGMGKTALMAEERRGAFLQGGICLWGDHAPQRAAVPLSGVGRALAQLVRFIHQEPDDVAQRWADVLRHAAGDLGLALVQVVPALEPLLEPLQPLPEVAPAACRRRLLGCLQRFILAACEVQSITLVLDDLQWADSATLDLLPLLLHDGRAGRGLAIVCAVEADDAAHAAAQPWRTALGQGPVAPTILALRPLDAHSVQALLVATLGPAARAAQTQAAPAPKSGDRDAAQQLPDRAASPALSSGPAPPVVAAPGSGWQPPVLPVVAKSGSGWQLPVPSRASADPALVAWAQAQTGGVPLLLVALLTHVLRHKLLLREATGIWMLHTEAVVGWTPEDLVGALPEPTRHALAVVACCGNDARLSLLLPALKRDHASALAALWPALVAGVLVPVGTAYRLAAHTHEEVLLRFAHPTYGLAAQAFLTAAERAAAHARLSHALLPESMGPHAVACAARTLLGAVHANAAAAAARELGYAQRLALARLNLRVGREAKRLAGLREAADFLRRAEALLTSLVPPLDPAGPAPATVVGSTHFGSLALAPEPLAPELLALRHEVLLQLAEADSLTGAVDAAEARLTAVLAATDDPLQRARIHQQRCVMYAHERQYARAIAAGLAGLRCVGVRLRAWPQLLEDRFDRRPGLWAPSAAQVAALLQAPRTNHARAVAVAELCEVLGPLCFFTRPALFRRLLKARLRCLLRWGIMPAAAGAFAGLTWLLMRGGRIREARAVSERGLELNSRPEEHPTAHLACLVMHASAVEWLAAPCVDMLRTYRKSYARCLEVGDVLLPGFFAVQDTFLATLVSQERVVVREARYGALYDDSAHGFSLQVLRAMNRCMRGEASLEHLAEFEASAERRGGYVASMFHACMAQWHCLSNRPVRALQCAAAALRHGAEHHLPEHLQAFFALFAGLAAVESARRPGCRQSARRVLRWASHGLLRASGASASLWGGAELLLRAHQEATSGRPGEAARLYESANEALPQIGSSVLVGLGWECVARFYSHQGLRSAAQLYLCKARRAYEQAAPAKVLHIEEEFPGLLTDAPDKVDIDPLAPTFKLLYTYQRLIPTPLRAGLGQVHALTEQLRGQPTLEALEACVCELLLRHGGATRVVIAREMGGGLVPVVQRCATAEGESLIEALPTSILGYTVRTGERVLINDAVVDEAFSRDPYLLQARPRSLASLALADGSRVWGVVYLENMLLTHAFGSECMAFVGFILGEAGPRVAELQSQVARDSRLGECALGVAREALLALDALRAVPRQGATWRDVERPLERILQLSEELTQPVGESTGHSEAHALDLRC